jgi:imidazolonepropionase-like amidohydrolase/ABC-type multidrug transport system permease subunit
MHPYITQIRMSLRLTLRDRGILFFSYLFPLIFFFMFGQLFHAEQGGASQIVDMVLTIGVLGSGFFGAGIRATADREQNILRRFKVAPISAGPILVASMAVGLILFLPLVALVLSLAHVLWGMPSLDHPVSLYMFVALGVVAFRALGGLIAAVANSMQESQLIIQLFYMPMLLLGGATIPIAIMPQWLQIVGQFLPSTHFSTGMQSILLGNETIFGNLTAAAALAGTAVLGTFLGVKLFRWEKEETLRPAAKLWLLAVMAPFLAIGVWQAHVKDNIAKSKILARDLNRGRTLLIRDARLFLGDGTVVEQGAVLIKDGKIAQVFTGPAPDPKSLKAEAIDAAGKTLLPGLIDVHVHLGAAGTFSDSGQQYTDTDKTFDRELAAYLFSGVTAVKSAGDALDTVLKHRATVNSGEKLGAELFAVGPMFTAEGGHGAEFLKYVPESVRATLEQQIVRLTKSADEARAQVGDLKQHGVDGIKAILDAGGGTTRYNRLDPQLLKAIGDAARQAGLPLVVHTGDSQDIADALDAGANGIEHGSMRDVVPAALFARMKQMGVSYDPTLTMIEGVQAFVQGSTGPLDRPLVQQTAPSGVLAVTKGLLVSPSAQMDSMRAGYAGYPFSLERSKQNLLAAYRAGVMLVTGTDAGNPMVLHGPGVHRELQLWMEAGIPIAAALQAATYNGARLLRADNRIGLIRQGYDASLLLVDGNPLQDISATERISMVLLKGERVDRSKLLGEE